MSDNVPTRAMDSGHDDAPNPEPPPFDKEAARARYRKLMRGPFMRSMYLLLAVVLLLSWGLGIAAAFSPSVAGIPNHDITVAPRTCVACHTQPPQSFAKVPPMPHPAAPSCGFCHRQSPPARQALRP